jgi:hypothetical protein
MKMKIPTKKKKGLMGIILKTFLEHINGWLGQFHLQHAL